jgi:GNAT superfamily N-acetyltransferase
MSEQTYSIRNLKEAELEIALPLHLLGLSQELELYNQILPGKSVASEGTGTLLQLLKQMVSLQEAGIFVAEIHEAKVTAGYCLVTKKHYPAEHPSFVGCINGIFILDDYKRMGIGRQLYAHAEQWVADQGITNIELYHMINDPRATEFWKAMGYIPVQLSCVKSLSQKS